MGEIDAGEPGLQCGGLDNTVVGVRKIGGAGVLAGERPDGFTVPYEINL
jgi:hypothetical protein